jgi:hypothetical protein
MPPEVCLLLSSLSLFSIISSLTLHLTILLIPLLSSNYHDRMHLSVEHPTILPPFYHHLYGNLLVKAEGFDPNYPSE